MNLLGDTIEKIAREKAGIIKSRVPVVVSQYQGDSGPLFSAVARELKAPIEFADKNYKVTEYKIKDGLLQVKVLNKKNEQSDNYELDLTGNYQLKNLLGVLNTIELIEKAGYLIEPANVKAALKQVSRLTGLMGRWQKLGEKPFVYADTGHNEDGIKTLLENLKQYTFTDLHFVFGAVNDKDVSKILLLLPKKAHYYFVRASVPRALEENLLVSEAAKLKLEGKAYPTVELGFKAAKKAAKKTDLILIGGSTFVVADALEFLNH